MSIQKKQRAFTLLEVLIAITLTAMVLGSVFALQSQNRKLHFKAIQKLEEYISLHSAITASWLKLDEQEIHPFRVGVINIEENKKITETKIHTNWQIETFDLLDQYGNSYLVHSKLTPVKK